VARRSLILDAGAIIALTRGDRRVRGLVAAAREDGGVVIVPPVVVTQTIRGGGADAAIHRLLRTVWVPFVGLRLARAAGELLGAAGTRDAADAQVMAEAIRSGPSILLTSDPEDMRQLAAGRPDVRVVAV
jgi:predicted nucleic acid-binding protein